MTKTNAMRLLEQAKITYQTSQYDYSEEDLSGVHAAEVLGFDPAMVFKTLVTRGDKTGPVVFVIPVAQELDLKKAAKVSGNKSVAMVHVKELLVLTGYIRGGCSPIGMKKKFPTYVDESFAAFLNGSKDIDDDAVWEQYLADLETYNLSRILEIRQACYDRYVAR